MRTYVCTYTHMYVCRGLPHHLPAESLVDVLLPALPRRHREGADVADGAADELRLRADAARHAGARGLEELVAVVERALVDEPVQPDGGVVPVVPPPLQEGDGVPRRHVRRELLQRLRVAGVGVDGPPVVLLEIGRHWACIEA